MTEYNDPTPISPLEPEYDANNVDPRVKNYSDQVRTKMFGKAVRESLARGIDIASIVANEAKVSAEEAVTITQQLIDGTFDDAELATAIESRLNQLEQDYAPTLTAIENEITDARGNEATLGAKMDNITSQLAENTQETSLYFLQNAEKMRTRQILAVQGFYSLSDNVYGKYRILSVAGTEIWSDIKDSSGITIFQISEDGELRAVGSTKKLKVMPKHGKFELKLFGARGNYDPVTKTGTDDSVIFQRAVNYLANRVNKASAATLQFTGRYKITSPIEWFSDVSLSGSGFGKSVLHPVGIGFAAIKKLSTIDNPLINCNFENFEIDGTEQGDDTLKYNVSEKGIFITFMKKSRFRDLYIHDTPATGLGADYLDDVIIDNVIAERAGRLIGINGGDFIGGSGIGVGTGAWEWENLKIVNCEARECGNYGIFVEIQGGVGLEDKATKGIRIIGCNASYNGRAGICDKGVEGLIVSGCNVYNNLYGVEVIQGGSLGSFENNNIRDNTESGVLLDFFAHKEWHDTLGYKFKNNEIFRNGKHGVLVTSTTKDIKNLSLKDNRIYENGACGILLEGSMLVIDPDISDNEIWDNGGANIAGYKDGVYIAMSLVNPRINNNKIYDNHDIITEKTQEVGIKLLSTKTITGGEMKDNDCRRNRSTGISLSGTLTGGFLAERNNPLNYSNNITNKTITASPMAYTGGYRPEVLYLIGTGITVSINGSNVITNASTATVQIQPIQSITITYTTLISAKVQVV
ncbi:right-handed parallel beta-helix repeat-containing protein [Gracilibacillus dipsosauri]|uniref:right-handed parallel beta-helix repeat-containing protein n=1 Tax=Gracilibacillus dipsosauri TaxID=178340 RepID=UPI00240A0815